jgi:hypothetical protein
VTASLSGRRQKYQLIKKYLKKKNQSLGMKNGLKGIWRVSNFWPISVGFDQFCTGLFLSADLVEFRQFWSLN